MRRQSGPNTYSFCNGDNLFFEPDKPHLKCDGFHMCLRSVLRNGWNSYRNLTIVQLTGSESSEFLKNHCHFEMSIRKTSEIPNLIFECLANAPAIIIAIRMETLTF